jgi:hypothetical protein
MYYFVIIYLNNITIFQSKTFHFYKKQQHHMSTMIHLIIILTLHLKYNIIYYLFN